MKRGATSVALILAAAAMSGCGSDDDSGDAKDQPTDETTSASSETCAESFNADAPVDFARLVRLSHADGAPILTGTYTGEEFEAQVYDTSLDGDGTAQAVNAGGCVVTEVSDGGTVLYVFAVGDDGQWHRFLESDPEVPLSTDPGSQLEDVVEVMLEEGQTSDSPDLVPTTS